MINFLRYLPAIVAIQAHLDALLQDAKEDDGVIDAEERFGICLGVLTATVRVLFPQLTEAQQDRIEDALNGLTGVRDKIADGYAYASEALNRADTVYTEINEIVIK